jgi:copper chaperone
MTKEVKFHVAMTCGGCSGAVMRILKKIEHVNEVDANLETKVVTVHCADEVADDTLLEALLTWSKSSGKAVSKLG